MHASGRPLLAQRDFRALLAARLTYALAVAAIATIVAFQVYDVTKDPLALGLLGLVEAIPALSIVLYGGHVADRRDRRKIVMSTSAATAICAATLAALSSGMSISFVAILAVIFLTGVASAFERPALSALEAQVIPLDEVTRALSITGAVSTAGAILGPAIGGVAIVFVGVAGAYALMATLVAISTLCVFLIAPQPMPLVVFGESLLASLSGGIRYVMSRPPLVGSMALDLFAVFFGGAIALLPVFASDVLHIDAAGLGLLRTVPSIGVLLAMAVASRHPPQRRAGRILFVCVAGFGVSMIVFGLSTTLWLSLTALFISGFTDGVSMVIRQTILRVLSPEHLRGRIASVNWVFIGASNELGYFESGVAARIIGTVPSVVAGGLVTLGVVGLVAALVPSLRDLDLKSASKLGPFVSSGEPASTLPDSEVGR